MNRRTMKVIVLSIFILLTTRASFSEVISYNESEHKFIGGTITKIRSIKDKLNKDHDSIRLLCTKYEENKCTTFRIVRLHNAELEFINSENLELVRADSLKILKKRFPLQANVLFRFSARAIQGAGLPGGILLTFPIDIGFLPLSVPLAFIKRGNLKRAFNKLFDLESKPNKKLGRYNYFELYEHLDNIYSNYP
jgi:hypothetical protein